MKLTIDRPYSDREKAARRLMEHAHAFEPSQDGRIYIEKINVPFLFRDKGSPAEYKAGLDLAISFGWLELHESGTFVKLTQSGAYHLPRTNVRLSPDSGAEADIVRGPKKAHFLP